MSFVQNNWMLIAVFLIPLLFVMFERIAARFSSTDNVGQTPTPEPTPAGGVS